MRYLEYRKEMYQIKSLMQEIYMIYSMNMQKN